MTPDSVLHIMQQALEVIIVILLVVLLPALIVGLLVSMFQAATQINEMTLSFIPKLIITMVTFVIAGPWIMNLVIGYTTRLIQNIPFSIG